MGLLTDIFFRAAAKLGIADEDMMYRARFRGQRAAIFPVLSPQPVTLPQAIHIFDKLAAMPDIAFGYAEDGCYARAHLMARRMFEMGLTPKKAWAFETDSRELTVKTPDGKEVTWWYHVAPTLPVLMPDGKVQDLVFDPSLFNGPVTIEEWGKVMAVHPRNLMVSECGCAPRGKRGDYAPGERTSHKTDSKAIKVMQDYLPLQPAQTPVLFASSVRGYVEALLQDGYMRSSTTLSSGGAVYDVNTFSYDAKPALQKPPAATAPKKGM